MYCKNCGKILGPDDKFCAECGTKVTVEKKKTAELEPMFFVEKREEPVKEKKAKRVIHLDEFNWDLDGYPTTPRKTEDVDFNWDSVLEEKVKKTEPEIVEPKVEKHHMAEELPRTVEELLASLPSDVLEMMEEQEEQPVVTEEVLEEVSTPEDVSVPEEDSMPQDAAVTEAASMPEEGSAAETDSKSEVTAEEESAEEIKTLEQIMEDFGEEPMEEPTRLIDKSQMKVDSVDRFYVFSKKQAEYQNMLDLEYDRIQRGLQETPEKEEAEPVAEEGILPVVKEEAPQMPVAPTKPLELVAIMWAIPPAGILIENQEISAQDADTAVSEEPGNAPEPSTEEIPPCEEKQEHAITSTATIVMKRPEEKSEEEPVKPEKEPVKNKDGISFADIFDDEEDEVKERKGGGFLKVIAILLIILIIVELGILGIQYFAKDSAAAAFINQAYGKIISFVSGSKEPAEEPAVAEEPSQPSELQILIDAQASKNENIGEILENKELTFSADEDYGYEELGDAYAFKNSLWYETEEEEEVTYGDEIIGVLIQYYSALPDKMNDVNRDVFDYVDDTTALYEELDAIEGDETRGYAINRLEIGEIKTGQKGFYVMVNVTSAEKSQSEQTQQRQLVYLEVNPNKQVIKIKETKNI